jgi:hypothetical protein
MEQKSVLDTREIHKRSLDRALRAAELRSQGLTYKEIGQQMGGVTVETARQAVLKGRRIMSRRSYPAEIAELQAIAKIASRIDIVWQASDDGDDMDDFEFSEAIDELREALRPWRQRQVAKSQIASFASDGGDEHG